jgi:hypothetical protein
MGHAIGDWNNDGLMDWFSTAIIDEKATCATVGCTFDDGGNKLYQNRGGRQFDDVAQQVDWYSGLNIFLARRKWRTIFSQNFGHLARQNY